MPEIQPGQIFKVTWHQHVGFVRHPQGPNVDAVGKAFADTATVFHGFRPGEVWQVIAFSTASYEAAEEIARQAARQNPVSCLSFYAQGMAQGIDRLSRIDANGQNG
jgi:hypothetical protein